MEFKNNVLSSVIMFAFAYGDYYVRYKFFDQDNIQEINLQAYISKGTSRKMVNEI